MSLPWKQIVKVAAVAVPVLLPAVASIVVPDLIASAQKAWAGKRIAILGRQRVGKTTLLDFLLGKEVREVSKPTVDPASGGIFNLPVGKKSVQFRVRHDQPGWAPENAYKGWKEDFDDADYVVYLFRADLVVQGDESAVSLVSDDLNQFKAWLKSSSKGTPPQLILVGTWADQNPMFIEDRDKFMSRVRQSHPIKLGTTKLNKADLVIGSLSSDAERKALVKSLRSYIQ
ncbi:GTPase domain-containing protein [Microbacterium lacticum]